MYAKLSLIISRETSSNWNSYHHSNIRHRHFFKVSVYKEISNISTKSAGQKLRRKIIVNMCYLKLLIKKYDRMINDPENGAKSKHFYLKALCAWRVRISVTSVYRGRIWEQNCIYLKGLEERKKLCLDALLPNDPQNLRRFIVDRASTVHLSAHTFASAFNYTESVHLRVSTPRPGSFSTPCRNERNKREGERRKHFLICRNDCSLLIGARCSRYRSQPPHPRAPFYCLASWPLRIAHLHQPAEYAFTFVRVCVCMLSIVLLQRV